MTILDKSANKAQLIEILNSMHFPIMGAGGGFAPIGTINFFDASVAPQGWLACDGSVINIADYPELATYYASVHGASNFYGGNGTTTFAVPDLRGEFLRGTGTNSHTNQGSGTNVGVHQDATQIPAFYRNSSNLAISRPSGQYNATKNADSAITEQLSVDTMTRATGATDAYVSNTTRPTNTSFLICVRATVAGDPNAHVYSTDEQVVGKWIDGSDLYEKVITGTTATANAEGVSTTNISYGSTYNNVMIVGGLLIKSANQFIPLNFPWGLPDGTKTAVATFSKPNELTVKTVAYYAECSFWVKIQYTKPTS